MSIRPVRLLRVVNLVLAAHLLAIVILFMALKLLLMVN
nr:MAG TPA: hypothetical protein [Caudoviricetes sp.]